MAARRKTSPKTALDQKGQTDPRAPLDSKSLLAAAQPVLKLLAEDLLARAKASKAVTAALQARHEAEQAQRRTADPFVVWQANLVDQVAAAWLLSCVFVRTLEDRGLLSTARLAGPGAADSQRLFLDLAPSLGERDYLLTVFRELGQFPAARDLFDAKHNPVWLLTPSAEAAKALLGLFRLPSPEAPTFRFGQDDTRFLGDLYQDLNEGVQKRYALLQTPRFVESFILDRTLERAIERFGLDETTVIDPTCGSGHFLLGSFERLFEHRLHAEPGLGVREAARKALDAVYGCDINPYAVAIARFRLTLAYLEKAGWKKLEGAPALPLHLVVADSLLHNAQLGQKSFLELEGQSAAVWSGDAFKLEDEAAAREVLYRRYAAVVGNPPYITVKDAVLRERYREMYSSAFRNYSLGVPFTERFFQLAREGGSVGMITANSFMKREFGAKLIEEYLPTVNLDLIVNTSGAYIPGHGTPTVLLFGTAESTHGTDVLAVLAKRGEPTTPDDAEQGLVWRSIADYWSQVGFENDYVSVVRMERVTLAKHPWSLGGGGAAELTELLEDRAASKLGKLISAVGRTTVGGEDDIWISEPGAWTRRGLGAHVLNLVIGECVRDWSITDAPEILYPYTTLGGSAVSPQHQIVRALWPWRTTLEVRTVFGKQIKASGRCWWEHLEHYTNKLQTPLSIAFAFVATHNHFVLDRGGKLFNRSAPVIKLPESATEDDHLALLAYLNSSTACFWMKQVFFPKTSGTNIGDVRGQEHRIAYEFAGTGLQDLPLPLLDRRLADYARAMLDLVSLRAEIGPERVLDQTFRSVDDLRVAISHASEEDGLRFRRLVALQEEIDWMVYALFGLAAEDTSRRLDAVPVSEIMAPNDRPFAREVPAQTTEAIWQRRSQAIRGLPLSMLETPLFKRPWFGNQGVFHRDGWTYEERCVESARALVDRFLELGMAKHQAVTTSQAYLIADARTSTTFDALATFVAESMSLPVHESLVRSLAREAVPFLAAWRHTDAGMDTFALWETTWNLQRQEDAGENVGVIPVPPKYDVKDFRDPNHFRLRGKLDVPKERFISYPGCESDQDREPVYGWAGWNHLQQAQALAALYQNRKQEEAWSKDRLTPMLAGLLELIPWIKQWHNEPSDEYGGMRLGDFFDGFLEGELRALSLTRDDLRAWRPESKKRGRATGKGKKAVEETTEGAASDE